MSQMMAIEVDAPDDLRQFKLPRGVDDRLQQLLDRQDQGHELSVEERSEAAGLVELADFLTVLRLRTERLSAGEASR